ncbi:MAG: hypothetical protein JNG85_05375 [Spirochaetaceae bacterium]|nr:hypothetical protein [Spirochaetaceae bacterium]
MNKSDDVIVFAHRGFRGVAPENTLLAAERAFELGCEWWELDVAASRDGTLVVVHDDSLKRTTDAAARFPSRKPWTVYDFDLAEIETLDAGSWYGRADPFGQVASGRVTAAELAGFAGLRIPSLRAALELTKARGKRVNVEIKDATGHPCDAWIVERVVALIRELGLADRVLVSSFNHEYLRRVKRAAPELEIGALVERRPASLVPLLEELGARSYNPGLRDLDEATVAEVRDAGFDVFVWTANEDADLRKLVDWGVTGVFTDFPDRLYRILAEK